VNLLIRNQESVKIIALAELVRIGLVQEARRQKAVRLIKSTFCRFLTV
jgi:hypothetical protein